MRIHPGFTVLYNFLDAVFWQYRASYDDDLPVLLGSMSHREGSDPLDPALFDDWTACVQEPVTLESGFEGLKCYLQKYIDLGEGEPKDITRLLQWVNTDPAAFTLWQRLYEERAAKGDGASPTTSGSC